MFNEMKRQKQKFPITMFFHKFERKKGVYYRRPPAINIICAWRHLAIIIILQVMYMYVSMISIVKHVTITRFFIVYAALWWETNFLFAYAALWWRSMIFIVLSSLETVHDTAQYRYCIFSLLYRLLRIRLKRQNPLLSYVRERKYIVNVQCGVQYTLLLLYLMLVMSYCAQYIN